MEGKIDSMKVLDSSNPQKPVVRMANLCVVSSHTVNTLFQFNIASNAGFASPLHVTIPNVIIFKRFRS
jgi:hypothetical protein